MSITLRAKKLDMETGDPLVIVMNSTDALDHGLSAGDRLWVEFQNSKVTAILNITDNDVDRGDLGIFEDLWNRFAFKNDQKITLDLLSRAKSIDYIAKKLNGEAYSESELKEIMKDIAQRTIRDIEMAYFMATFFNPGFSEDETLFSICGMAESGEILNFKNIKNGNPLVIDKHSIGGIAGKGVTPILVPIVAACGFVIPNTSTRAITTPAGTTDILEVVMPMELTKEKIYETVKQTGGCLAWGGCLNLAPADDILIKVEKGLHLQSYQKLLVSIIAKKVAMGVTHVLIDIPYGKGTKVESSDDLEMLSKTFVKLFAKVGIVCETFPRHIIKTDGNGVGPTLEMRDILRILERSENRPLTLEKYALEMAGKLIELAGGAVKGKGFELAKSKLENGEALKKFWEIALCQGAKKVLKAQDLKIGTKTYEIPSDREGEIRTINNLEVVKIARALGTPSVKEAGMYFEKSCGDLVKKGDVIARLYATSSERLELGKSEIALERLLSIK